MKFTLAIAAVLVAVVLGLAMSTTAQSPYDNVVDNKPDVDVVEVVEADPGPKLDLQPLDGVSKVEVVGYLGSGKYLIRVFTNVRANILGRNVVIPQSDYIILTELQYRSVQERVE